MGMITVKERRRNGRRLTGRSPESIARREYGRAAVVLYSSDPNTPWQATVVRYSRNTGTTWEATVLAEWYVDEDARAARTDTKVSKG